MASSYNFDKELSIVIAGEAGQGIETISSLIAKVIKVSDFNVYYTLEYMSRIKGGCNSSTIRISNDKVSACNQNANFVFAS